MAENTSRDLAIELTDQQSLPGDDMYFRRGKVTAVGASTATVTIGGASISDVPYYTHTTLATNDTVDVLFDGPSPRILGKLR